MGSHFYDPKTGELIEGGLREARKRSALPSPTTVLGILGSFGLKEYFRRQMFEATATTARQPNWTDDEYYAAVTKYADEHGQAARDKGGDFHDLVQRFHYEPDRAPAFGYDAGAIGMRPQFEAYVDWYSKSVRRSIMVEQTVIGQGYAGRVDHVAEMMDGKVLCLDVKTQDTTKKKGKFTYYDQWPIQLAAYAGACKIPIHGLMSVAVSSNLPAVVETKLWERPVDYYHDIFMGLLKFWKHSNSYFPE
jgi:hypothetical protein